MWQQPTGMAAFVEAAFSLLAREARGQLISCGADKTLPQSGAAAGRVAIVSNLRNAAGMAPNAVLQLVRTVLWLPPGAAFVLVYEDGSGDALRHWLALLQLLLTPIGVPFKFTLDGGLGRQPKEGRIAHLARLRNLLVSPFYPAHSVQQVHCKGGHRPSQTTGFDPLFATTIDAACFRPEQFVFFNDVFFCRDDVVRLMLHDADLACGYDAYYNDRRRVAMRRALLLQPTADWEWPHHPLGYQQQQLQGNWDLQDEQQQMQGGDLWQPREQKQWQWQSQLQPWQSRWSDAPPRQVLTAAHGGLSSSSSGGGGGGGSSSGSPHAIAHRRLSMAPQQQQQQQNDFKQKQEEQKLENKVGKQQTQGEKEGGAQQDQGETPQAEMHQQETKHQGPKLPTAYAFCEYKPSVAEQAARRFRYADMPDKPDGSRCMCMCVHNVCMMCLPAGRQGFVCRVCVLACVLSQHGVGGGSVCGGLDGWVGVEWGGA